MKLYFYFLETPYNKKPHIRVDECEVEEKPKTYKPVDKFPNGYYYCSVKKEDIGTFSGYNNDVVILLENDIEKVAGMFKQKCKSRIEREKQNIRSAEESIEKQNCLIEMIEEWRTK